MEVRESRVQEVMVAERLDRMQAVNVVRAENYGHDKARRDGRAFDYRFGREF